jgi:hypothetical protein
VAVIADPATDISAPDRRLWHDTSRQVAAAIATARAADLQAGRLVTELESASRAIAEVDASAELADSVDGLLGRARDAAESAGDTVRQLGRVYGALLGATSRPTADQLTLVARAREALAEAVGEVNALMGSDLPPLRERLDAAGVPWTPGRTVRQ